MWKTVFLELRGLGNGSFLMVLLSPVTVLAISITPVVSVSNDGKISAEEDVSDKFRQEHALIPLPSPQ